MGVIPQTSTVTEFKTTHEPCSLFYRLKLHFFFFLLTFVCNYDIRRSYGHSSVTDYNNDVVVSYTHVLLACLMICTY